VAVFGASEKPDSVGGRVFGNLLTSDYKGKLVAVNPKYEQVFGEPCYPGIPAHHDPIDLAVVATPANTVPGVIAECGRVGIKAAIILSAGFGEAGEAGRVLQQQTLETARARRVRLVGPNCLGILRPHAHLNATFSKNQALPGHTAFISQSGALCTAVLDWALARQIGFSGMVSTGDAADLGVGEFLDYFAMDDLTHSILVYLEGVPDSRSFLSGLRAAARQKPVLVMKSGRHPAGSRAAFSHTGSLVGADDVFTAALERAGAVRVDSVDELFAAASILEGSRRMRGRRLAIISNAGGPAVIAADRASELGLELPQFTPETQSELNRALPAHWSKANPVDLLGDAGEERYRAAMEACELDPQVDVLLVMLTPQAMTNASAVATVTVETQAKHGKPILTCWMGGDSIREGQSILEKGGLPTFNTPEKAVEAISYLVNYHDHQRLLLQTPGPLTDAPVPDLNRARQLVDRTLQEGRGQMRSAGAKELLQCFGIPVVPSRKAANPQEAQKAAAEVGYPVVLKIDSPDITHKSDVGGVELNLRNPDQVHDAFISMMERAQRAAPTARISGVLVEPMLKVRHGRELMIGIVRDPVFGPAISFGAGGVAVEVFRDRAVALPPLNESLIRSLIGRTKVSQLLGAFRGMLPVDESTVFAVLSRISDLACFLPEILELDINPLVAHAGGVVALDARVLLQSVPAGRPRFSHLAIHPYPDDLARDLVLPGGESILLRPIRPEDANMEQEFVRSLSPESRYLRFMESIHELAPKLLVRFTQIDYDREMAFVAISREPGAGERQIGVARYITNPDGKSCEFAVAVSDGWQGKGVGSALMNALMERAKAKGLEEMMGEVLKCNRHMLELSQALGFRQEAVLDDVGLVTVRRDLRS